jgi:hypothetical protein
MMMMMMMMTVMICTDRTNWQVSDLALNTRTETFHGSSQFRHAYVEITLEMKPWPLPSMTIEV